MPRPRANEKNEASITSLSESSSNPSLAYPLSASCASVPEDGGWVAWCTVFGAWLSLNATFGYTNAFGVYQDIYSRTHAASASQISWIGSTQIYLMLLISLPAGKLLDSGYFRCTTAVGSVLYTFSLFMLSLADPNKYYQIFLSQGLGMGIGSGLLYIPMFAVQAHHWRRRRSLAMGLAGTGSSVGGIFFSIMLNQLFFHHGLSFAWTVRASAFVVLGLLLAANLLVCDRQEMIRSSVPTPNIRALFKDVPFMITIVAVFLVDCGIFFPYFYLQLFSIRHGTNSSVAFYMLAVLNGASIPGRIILNGLSPKLGVFNSLIFSGLACAVAIFAMLGVSSIGEVAVIAVLYGFFSGAFLSLLTPSIATLAKNESEIGMRLGIAYALSCMGYLVGTPVGGALLGITYPWWRAIAFSGVMVAGGVAFLACAYRLLLLRKNDTAT